MQKFNFSLSCWHMHTSIVSQNLELPQRYASRLMFIMPQQVSLELGFAFGWVERRPSLTVTHVCEVTLGLRSRVPRWKS